MGRAFTSCNEFNALLAASLHAMHCLLLHVYVAAKDLDESHAVQCAIQVTRVAIDSVV